MFVYIPPPPPSAKSVHNYDEIFSCSCIGIVFLLCIPGMAHLGGDGLGCNACQA